MRDVNEIRGSHLKRALLCIGMCYLINNFPGVLL